MPSFADRSPGKAPLTFPDKKDRPKRFVPIRGNRMSTRDLLTRVQARLGRESGPPYPTTQAVARFHAALSAEIADALTDGLPVAVPGVGTLVPGLGVSHGGREPSGTVRLVKSELLSPDVGRVRAAIRAEGAGRKK